jgi:hypothetical protein
MSPTARTLDHLRRQGYVAAVVERWIPQANIRRDLFGCIDIVVVKPGCPVLGVQATSISNVGARLKKAKAIPELRTWLTVASFQVWGWVKRRGVWTAKIVEVQAVDLAEVVLCRPPRQRRKSRFQPLDLFAPIGD